MQQTVRSKKRGIHWTREKNLKYLEFTDDLCLTSYKLEDLQAKTNKLAEEAAKTGVQVNIEKTEVMKMPNPQHQQQQQQTPITINGRNLEEVASAYLGSTVSTTGGTDEEVKVRIGKASQAFINLKPVWRSSALSTE
ncbi:unnamed protein product [Heterobilharzia americana]|nr:unnamed protein product [Heterobilharzia americana]